MTWKLTHVNLHHVTWKLTRSQIWSSSEGPLGNELVAEWLACDGEGFPDLYCARPTSGHCSGRGTTKTAGSWRVEGNPDGHFPGVDPFGEWGKAGLSVSCSALPPRFTFHFAFSHVLAASDWDSAGIGHLHGQERDRCWLRTRVVTHLSHSQALP